MEPSVPEVPLPEGFERQALTNWKVAVSARSESLIREKEDLRMMVPDLQWDPAARAARAGTTIDGIPIPERSCLSSPKLLQPISIIRNQMQSANMGILISPLSADAKADTAEIYQDLYRSIERDPDDPASQARNWAFDRALQAGTGWYRVATVYDPASDDPFDQKIVIQRILYQDAVLIDPSATKMDYSDAQWAFLTYWKPLVDFKREWPNANVSSGDSFDIEGLNASVPGWAKGTTGSEAVQVGEYFFKHYRKVTKKSRDGRTREAQEPYVCRYLLAPGGDDGFEILEKDDLNSPNIPLIPVTGTELQTFDEKRRIYGIIHQARDPLKMHIYALNNLTETVALLPKAPYTLDPRQIEGYEGAWKQANVRTFPYLPARAIIDGQLIGMPQRTMIDGASLTPSMMLMQEADELIQSATATPDPVLGKTGKDQSGKAIERLQGQSEASNSGYLYNFAEVTLRYEAKVVMGMIPKIYDRPGRIAHVTDVQGEVRKVMLNAPYIEQGDQMIQLPDGGQQLQAQGIKPKFYDFSKGIYGEAVNIGKSHASQMQEAADQIAMFVEKDPEMGIVLAPDYLRNQSWYGHKEAAKLAEEYRAIKFPQIGKKNDKETVESLKAQIEQMQAQMQQAQQAAQQMQAQLQTDQAKQQATIQKAQIEAQSRAADTQTNAQIDMKLAEIETRAKMQIEQLQSQTEIQVAMLKEQAETERLMMQQKFEALQARLAPERNDGEGS